MRSSREMIPIGTANCSLGSLVNKSIACEFSAVSAAVSLLSMPVLLLADREVGLCGEPAHVQDEGHLPVAQNRGAGEAAAVLHVLAQAA